MVKPHSSNFRVITINFWGVRILRKFTVLAPGTCGLKKKRQERNEPHHEKTCWCNMRTTSVWSCLCCSLPHKEGFTIIRPNKKKKKWCVFQVSALKKLGMVGWHKILFYQNILYGNCIFHYIFHHISVYLTILCSHFTIKCLGSEQKPR